MKFLAPALSVIKQILSSIQRHSSPLFRGFIEKEFPWGQVMINFGLNLVPMETFSHILASFDIFQVILNAFPRIFIPIVHAFQGMFTNLYDMAGKQFTTHPGLISGTVIFLLVYMTWSGLTRLRQAMVSARQSSPERSL
jgi:hypothetical protein